MMLQQVVRQIHNKS